MRDPLFPMLLPFFKADAFFPQKTKMNRKSIFLLPLYFFHHLCLQEALTASSPFVLKSSHFALCAGLCKAERFKQNLTWCQNTKMQLVDASFQRWVMFF